MPFVCLDLLRRRFQFGRMIKDIVLRIGRPTRLRQWGSRAASGSEYGAVRVPLFGGLPSPEALPDRVIV
jgi:hypothetical protein